MKRILLLYQISPLKSIALRLKSLAIKGFRNLKDLKLTFEASPDLFALVGKNGQGKTNLLEAIYLCNLSKSFRAHENLDLIGFDEDFCRIEAVSEGGEAKLIEVIIEKNPNRKTLKVNGVRQRVTEFIGHLPVVFFSPDDMSMIHQAPSLRRRYLDVLLSQLDSEYLLTLIDYEKAVRHRNTLLKQVREGRGKPHEIDFWDEKVAALGITLVTKRRALVKTLNPLACNHYRGIAHQKDNLVIGYQVSVEPEKLFETLAAHRERDIATGVTSAGPHRDDLIFMNNDRDMALFASRGEWRSLVLALKFAELELLRERLNTEPILLLDDVFSELDDTRQQYLFSNLKGAQAFVTTTHREFLKPFKNHFVLYQVQDGGVSL